MDNGDAPSRSSIDITTGRNGQSVASLPIYYFSEWSSSAPRLQLGLRASKLGFGLSSLLLSASGPSEALSDEDFNSFVEAAIRSHLIDPEKSREQHLAKAGIAEAGITQQFIDPKLSEFGGVRVGYQIIGRSVTYDIQLYCDLQLLVTATCFYLPQDAITLYIFGNWMSISLSSSSIAAGSINIKFINLSESVLRSQALEYLAKGSKNLEIFFLNSPAKQIRIVPAPEIKHVLSHQADSLICLRLCTQPHSNDRQYWGSLVDFGELRLLEVNHEILTGFTEQSDPNFRIEEILPSSLEVISILEPGQIY
ncbi:hypothetical protein K469DRAFT_750634 [Zopfia rhizophila CBS 207.26]|uniref:Uncharacterized protein n=1 Tax=Zopfia rhizophila CBS 207.26 TaxID=1314779 RepID=A0A6A6DZP1_9PEZI|nr:hypothetical protein K469DRAFT_750634 [Zopfia rhizophila CBS 207.26]